MLFHSSEPDLMGGIRGSWRVTGSGSAAVRISLRFGASSTTLATSCLKHFSHRVYTLNRSTVLLHVLQQYVEITCNDECIGPCGQGVLAAITTKSRKQIEETRLSPVLGEIIIGTRLFCLINKAFLFVYRRCKIW